MPEPIDRWPMKPNKVTTTSSSGKIAVNPYQARPGRRPAGWRCRRRTSSPLRKARQPSGPGAASHPALPRPLQDTGRVHGTVAPVTETGCPNMAVIFQHSGRANAYRAPADSFRQDLVACRIPGPRPGLATDKAAQLFARGTHSQLASRLRIHIEPGARVSWPGPRAGPAVRVVSARCCRSGAFTAAAVRGSLRPCRCVEDS